ncbi:hypothetical protein DM02DRAFT_202826 [Periconia macrospinosa]|uniref:Centrosomin N-terminal motif 1 domain-containing protein n=1 Tax=Periconia macrospinosa TaxID=97972 RepID=A0A2V1E1I5_9PLEO|nr:hypothetical protein DM02DRAFT_202826 [Periconia macrospinosa]
MSSPTARRPTLSVGSSPSNRSSSPAPGTSMSIEPKSEYLRHALEAQRAKNATPAPSPLPTPTEPRFTAQSGTSSMSDPWLDQAKDEDFVSRTTPNRSRRRPSDTPAPRRHLQREQQTEVDKLKEALFSLNMKLELVRKQNNELKDGIEDAHHRIAELEHLEDENYDLRDDNNRLQLRIQNVVDEVADLRERNAVILQIQDESVQNMEKQNNALEEAAEIIFRLEQQKETLSRENAILREQVTTLQTPRADDHHASMDGNTKYPIRVYSIDESRPSTSHFDSDYYSQPASPRLKSSKESLPSLTVSDRARDFLTLNKESKKSTQDLKNRMSVASARPKSTAPEVPQIPEAYRESRVPVSQYPVRTPRRIKTSSQLSSNVASPSSSTRTDQEVPRTPTNQMEGLRGMFRGNLSLDTSARSSRGSIGHTESPLESRNLRASQGSSRSVTPRHLSRQTQASTSNEQPSPVLRRSAENVLQEDEWETHNPRDSLVSDLTTEPDRDPRTRWWKTVEKLVSQGGSFTHAPTHRANAREQNFLFNPNESDEEFIAKMKDRMPSRRDR